MKKELLTSVYNKMRSRLIARAKSVVISDDEARDVIQEAFCNLWARPTRLEHEAQAEALFMTAVRNLSIDVIRRDNAKRTSSLEENTDMPDTGDTDAENRMETYRQVERIAGQHLSERDRDILFRRDRDEWSFEDIAEAYGTTPANVRVIVARARKTIRNIYLDNAKRNI